MSHIVDGVEVSGDNHQKQRAITEKFDSHFRKVKNETAMFSTMSHAFNHPDFKELVEMGDKMVPYIFYKITQYGFDWVYPLLLGQILPIKPTMPKEIVGKFNKVLIFWLQWYEESEYKQIPGVYFGLEKY